MEQYMHGDTELYHHGIRGMKWGIRRYQNKDGSLTAAGKKRIAAETEALKKEEQTLKNRKATQAKFDKLAAKRKALEEKKAELDGKDTKKTDKKANSESDEPVKKSLSDLSITELRSVVERARLEDEYRRLRPEPAPPEKHAMAKKIVKDAVVPAITNAGRKFLEDTLNDYIEKVSDRKVDPNSLDALKKTYEKLDYKQKINKIMNPDKYLSEEDKNKRQQRTFEAEDRAAKIKGYKDAADEAKARRQADEAARAANESRSNDYYNRLYNKKGDRISSYDGTDATPSASSSAVRKLLSSGTTSSNNISSGKSHVSGLLESQGNRSVNEIGYIDADGNFRAYP